MTRNSLSRSVIGGLLLALCAALPLSVQAQSYPTKPVRFIVPYPPGGGSDTMGRLLADKLKDSLGQPVVVENKPGASGNVGLELAARSAPDGYTIVINPNSISITLPLFGSSVDPMKDFTPIMMVSQAPIVIGGSGTVPVKTIPEFVAYAKANVGKTSYASCGTGGLQQIAMELLKKSAGIDVTHIPYNGCGQPIPDLLAGRVPFFGSVMNSVSNYLKNGELRAYAISNAKRSTMLPDVPTLVESGYPDAIVDNWIGIFGPAGMPADVVAKLNKALNDALKSPDVREKMATQFIEPVGGTPEELGNAVKTDAPKYAKLIKDIGIQKPN